MSIEVRLFTEISRISIKEHLDVVWVCYGLLREVNRSENTTKLSAITQDKALSDLRKYMGMDARIASKILERGDGIFWNLTTNRKGVKSVRFVSPKNLFRHFGISSGYMVKLDLKDLKGTQRRRATLYDSWFANPNGREKEISREKLVELFGYSKPTLIAWEKIAGTLKHPNVVPFKITEDTIEHIQLRGDDIQYQGKWLSDVDNDGVLELVVQFPNSYKSSVVSYKLPKHLRNDIDSDSNHSLSFLYSSRKFFDSFKAAYDATRKTGKPTFYKTTRRSFYAFGRKRNMPMMACVLPN